MPCERQVSSNRRPRGRVPSLAPSVVPFDRDVGFAPTADNGLATRLTRTCRSRLLRSAFADHDEGGPEGGMCLLRLALVDHGQHGAAQGFSAAQLGIARDSAHRRGDELDGGGRVHRQPRTTLSATLVRKPPAPSSMKFSDRATMCLKSSTISTGPTILTSRLILRISTAEVPASN
jgi:hypothetical protein